MKLALLYVMFEEYDLLAEELRLLATQTDRDFTFVCVTGQNADQSRIRAQLEAAPFPHAIFQRTEDNGPAGGFYDGERWCLEQGFDAIVHMESDCFPMSDNLVARLREGLRTHEVVAPLCMPERLAMGWRFCAVTANVLRTVGLSYKALYFMTEDVYFIRNVSRGFPMLVLDDVHVYHAPVVDKHTHTDVYMCPFPHLISRNHMLFGNALIRRHRNGRDVVNQIGYIVCLLIYAHHLKVRGKSRSAKLVVQGILDGLLGRESRIVKERMEKLGADLRVMRVETFAPDLVLDKQDTVALGDVALAFSSTGRNVLIKRSSQFLTFVSLFLARSVALTDGDRTWLLKDRPYESAGDRLAFPLVVAGALLVALPILLFGLAMPRGGRGNSAAE